MCSPCAGGLLSLSATSHAGEGPSRAASDVRNTKIVHCSKSHVHEEVCRNVAVRGVAELMCETFGERLDGSL